MADNPVLKTLIYESIFDFPMKKEEIWKFLISPRKITKAEFERQLRNKKIHYDKKTNFYYLKKSNVKERSNRSRESASKMKIAQKASKILSYIPTMKFIGISGSLARFAAVENDDIDLFIYCERGTIWTTRFFSVILMKVFGLYRSSSDYKDKVCLNMFVSEPAFPKNRQNLYNAIEISQIYPLSERGESYQYFIESNRWTDKFLSNSRRQNLLIQVKKASSNFVIESLFQFILMLGFENAVRGFQLSVMRKRTKETIGENLLAFHPIDFKSALMARFRRLQKEY